jgi:putative peptide zinc metalloprotease protein
MLTASLSSLLFNGNPLLRYDGYYVLSDAIEVPNLAQRGARYWSYLMSRHVFGTRYVQDFPATRGERIWFLLYTPVSTVYRIAVTIGIALFLMSKYLAAGVALALWGIATGVVLPVARGIWSVLTAPVYHRTRARALTIIGGLVAGGLAILLWLPMPLHTSAEGVAWLPDDAIVRAGADGFVREVRATPGASVTRGDVVIVSDDPELTARVRFLRARETELEEKLDSVRFSDRVEAIITEKELSAARIERAREEHRAALLDARANSDGTFIMPLSADVPGRFFHRGDVFGYILPQNGSQIVRAAIAQEDIDLVRHHVREARAKLTDWLDQETSARALREVPAGRDQLPSAVLGTQGGGETLVDPRDEHGMTALNRVFQVDLELASPLPEAVYGSRVYVRFDHEWEPLGAQLWRRMRQLLLSRLDF